MSDGFDGYAVLEEAALTMVGAGDEEAILALYRQQLESALRAHLGDDRGEVAELAEKFTEIIVRRRREIELARGSNSAGVQ